MMAADDIDHVDSGMEPEADSQYRVAPFVQEIFDEGVAGATTGCLRRRLGATRRCTWSDPWSGE